MVLCPVIRKLLHKRVVLASASPRRQEILRQAGLRFEVVPSRFKEMLPKALFPSPPAYAVETAKQKALEVARRMHQKDLRAPDVVIGADTIVAVGGLILEKPVDKQDAYSMLSRLSGKEHSVFTGVAIVHCCSRDGRLDTDVSEFYEETRVRFSELSEDLLWEYIDSGEPMDKAGGYGIQALGGMLVEQVHGDFLNVVGFPLNRFCKKLAELYYPSGREDPRPAQSHQGRGGRDEDGGERTQAAGPEEAVSSRTGHSPPPFPTGLLELVDSFKASKALFTACKLKVFDLLKDGAPLKAVDVAGKLGASACGTGRLLDTCVALGFLQKTDRGYSNTETANLHLTSDGAYSLRGLVLHHSDHPWDLSARPESAGRDGVDPHDGALGERTGPPCQASCTHSEETRLGLLRAMHSLAKLTARHVATAFDLSRFSSACDLGGCTGALAHALAREYPRLRVTVFDLPEVLQHVAGFQPDGPRTEQVSFLPGDFFEDSLPEADLYVVSRILRDWPDGKVHELLSRVARACKPGGGLLLVDVAAGPEAEAEAEGLRRRAGGERSAAVYAHLLRRLGFADVRAAGAGVRPLALLGTRGAP
ncbi:probable bifunctional dTTP/UTP pyrophosphatase/methyltransferase protein isoform X1 [Equus przewalskii]|uniref:Probable bifunctional dTTP/UTP pyrophosphatase/methyltransferase protein isoform X1 n=2 Tax=Equus przewalskii TaxID=9798 RepID=A0ABM4N402_EQUPR